MKILITGDRDWTDKELIRKILSNCKIDEDYIIHGNARGADILAGEVATELHIFQVRITAEWDKYGKSAGPIRNRKMLDMNPHIVLAFHDDLENSKGTRDCVQEALRRGIPVFHYTTKSELPVRLQEAV